MLRKHSHKKFNTTYTVAIITIFLVIPTFIFIIFRAINNVSVPDNTLVYNRSFYAQSKHPDCHIIQLGAFTIETPKEFLYIKRRGYDSYIGEITNSKDTLYFDYGMYSYNFQEETSLEHTFKAENIHGKKAIIVRPKRRGRGLIGVYFKNVQNSNHLVISGYDIRDEETIISMFRTIKFNLK